MCHISSTKIDRAWKLLTYSKSGMGNSTKMSDLTFDLFFKVKGQIFTKI